MISVFFLFSGRKQRSSLGYAGRFLKMTLMMIEICNDCTVDERDPAPAKGWLTPYKYGDKPSTNWCRNSSIHSRTQFGINYYHLGLQRCFVEQNGTSPTVFFSKNNQRGVSIAILDYLRVHLVDINKNLDLNGSISILAHLSATATFWSECKEHQSQRISRSIGSTTYRCPLSRQRETASCNAEDHIIFFAASPVRPYPEKRLKKRGYQWI